MYKSPNRKEKKFYILLRDKLSRMNRRTKLFKILKEELTLQGYWKNLPRGNPRKGFDSGWGKAPYWTKKHEIEENDY